MGVNEVTIGIVAVFFMVVPVQNLTMDVWILEGDLVGLLNFITSKTISSYFCMKSAYYTCLCEWNGSS